VYYRDIEVYAIPYENGIGATVVPIIKNQRWQTMAEALIEESKQMALVQ